MLGRRVPGLPICRRCHNPRVPAGRAIAWPCIDAGIACNGNGVPLLFAQVRHRQQRAPISRDPAC